MVQGRDAGAQFRDSKPGFDGSCGSWGRDLPLLHLSFLIHKAWRMIVPTSWGGAD